MDLWEGIQQLAGVRNLAIPNIFYAEVKSVDEANRKCTVSATTLESTEITLSADLCLLGNTGLVVIPSVGSTVLVLYSKTVNTCIIQHSYVDKLLLNGDEKGGLVVVGDLITKLNNVENLVNDLVTKYNAHIHPVTGASTGVTTSIETTTITPTVEEDIASTTIFQG